MSHRHGAREQKKLAKQKAKQKEKRREIARLNSTNPNIRLQGTEHWPIVACLVPTELWDVGLGSLLIARRAPDGKLVAAAFLVDVFCLGVKNAVWTVGDEMHFRSVRSAIEAHCTLREAAPEMFAKIVYQAADYGQSLGFAPHRDFRFAQRLLAGIDPSQCKTEFEFGKGGRPLYVQGPAESAEQARVNAERVRGQGGEFVLGPTGPHFEDNEEIDELIEFDEEGFEL